MSSSQSQDTLYKDKCLYIAMNVLLSKIQRLETEIAQLKTQHLSKHTNDTLSSFKKRIDMLELRQKETVNKKQLNCNNDSNCMESAIDLYLKDIDLVEDFQLDMLNNSNNKQIDNK